MTKRQFGIIFTLMAMIVTVGVLAVKLNEGGYVDTSDLGAALADGNIDTIGETEDETETSNTEDYFYNMRATKEQQDATYLDDLQTIKADTTATAEQVESANAAILEKTQTMEMEDRVELDIKNKGYEDAICTIDGGEVKVYIKVEEDLTQESSALIQSAIEEITTLNDITIVAKK